MNHRFFSSGRCLAVAFCLCFGTVLFSQNASILPDSLPHPDSISDWDLSVLTLKIAKQSKAFETELTQKSLSATAARDVAELDFKIAKQDTLTSKTSLDSLSGILKIAKNLEKTAQKQQKQAVQITVFAEKVSNMDAPNQRKNIQKVWKQVKELDHLLHPPPPLAERPIADIIGTQSVSDTPIPPLAVDSSATAETASVKRKNKDKKIEKTDPKYKSYDPATDPMRTPPQRPCSLAVSTRDEFSGETYRETQREEIFRYTNPVMKKVLPPDQPHIRCEAALSVGGANIGLHLSFSIRDANARKAFGNFARNSVAILKFLDGTTFTVNNLRSDDGTPDASGQMFNYRAQYTLDASILKKIRKNELDKIRVAWSTGYEDYDVQGVDVLMRQAKCLFE